MASAADVLAPGAERRVFWAAAVVTVGLDLITKLIAGEFTDAQAHAFAVKGVQEVIVKYLSS